MESNCTTCSLISSFVDRCDGEHSFQTFLGPFSSLGGQQPFCHECQRLRDYFQGIASPPRTIPLEPSCQMVISSSGRTRVKIGHFSAQHKREREIYALKNKIELPLKFSNGETPCDHTHKHPSVELIPSQKTKPLKEHFLDLNPANMNVEELRGWLEQCDAHHHGTCYNVPTWRAIDFPPSLFLIDVITKCIVQVSGFSHQEKVSRDKRYVALSYMWGDGSPGIVAKNDNFEHLKKAGSLDSPLLPHTIRDAMILTAALSIQYLWVDRLCIIQDGITVEEKQRKAEQLSWMDSIYANSYFTLVAANAADPSHGLRGIGGASEERTYIRSMFNFGPNCRMIVAPPRETIYNTSQWDRRGWTFQERLLSHRCLIFHENTVFWECLQAFFEEGVCTEVDGKLLTPQNSQKPMPVGLRLVVNPWPDVTQFANLANRYSNRLLSDPRDGLIAFSGALKLISRSFPSGFFFGLSVFFFDLNLMWTPVTPITRRTAQCTKGLVTDLPTWCWAEWAGNISLNWLWFDWLYKAPHSMGLPIAITPCVKWYRTRTDTKPHEEIRIENSWHKYQSDAKDSTKELPEGWSRHKIEPVGAEVGNSNHLFTPTTIFKHHLIPDMEFFYPVPIPCEPPAPDLRTWSPYLTFTTETCKLKICCVPFDHKEPTWEPKEPGAKLYDNRLDEPCQEEPISEEDRKDADRRKESFKTRDPWASVCTPIKLQDSRGEWAGMFYSNCPEDIIHDKECEVIKISDGVAHNDPTAKFSMVKFWLTEYKYIEKLKSLSKYEFHNVMLIRWKEGIAYRQAVGRVWKDAWNRQKVEKKKILLG